jgi:hypothetical protein
MNDLLGPNSQNSNPAVDQLVGEGKKFKDVEALAKSKIESDNYIQILTARMDELRADHLKLQEERNTSAHLNELIDRLDNRRNDTPATPPGNDVKPLQQEDIQRLLDSELTKRESAAKQAENLRISQAKLRQAFGEDYQPILKQKLEELEITPEFADNLAKTNPNVFSRTFGLEEQPRPNAYNLPRSSVRQEQFSPKIQKKDWSYYQELKKGDSRMYLDPKVSLEMHNSLMELGPEAFWGNNQP